MVVKASDQWETPQWLFDELNAEFDFDIDLCANKTNAKCLHYYDDYLIDKMLWNAHYHSVKLNTFKCAFLNPPYSNPRPFVEKAFKDAKENKITIVCLLKCDPSTRTWAVFWDYNKREDGYCEDCIDNRNHDRTICNGIVGKRFSGMFYKPPGPKPGVEVRFLPKRVSYTHPDYCMVHHRAAKIIDGKRWCVPCNKPVVSCSNFPSCVVIFRGHEMS